MIQAFCKEHYENLLSKSLQHTKGVRWIMIIILQIRAENQEEVS